jgi:hypothetical protein
MNSEFTRSTGLVSDSSSKQGQGKVAPVLNYPALHEVRRNRGSTDPRILNLGT